MATDDQELSRQQRFEKYNPYAEPANQQQDRQEGITLSQLAIAYEISALRTEIHFTGKRGRS